MIYLGDMRAVLAGLDADSFDAVVTDPPYGLGFMDASWDHGVPGVEYWAAALRVAKPGAHLVAFGGTRTFHRLACAIEDAGFELRDSIAYAHESGEAGDCPWLGAWVYGNGFPKSRDVGAQLDKRKDWASLRELQGAIRSARIARGLSQSKAAQLIGMIGPGEVLGGGGYMWFETGMRIPTADEYRRLKAALGLDDSADEAFEEAEREVIGTKVGQDWSRTRPASRAAQGFAASPKREFEITAPASQLARQWAGWGTALKPAWEPIVLARKPMKRTTAENVVAYGVGPLNVGASRVEDAGQGSEARWPANVVHDGSAEATQGFPALDGVSSSRFFYSAKASADNRGGEFNLHPTVKPLSLMRYLVRLVTPPGGLVLDPFAGSGSTLVAAEQMGFRSVGVELDPSHVETAKRRRDQVAPLFAEALTGTD